VSLTVTDILFWKRLALFRTDESRQLIRNTGIRQGVLPMRYICTYIYNWGVSRYLIVSRQSRAYQLVS